MLTQKPALVSAEGGALNRFCSSRTEISSTTRSDLLATEDLAVGY